MLDTTPNRILIIRPSALGDVCRTVPVLVSLKAAFPEARIDWLVQDSFLPAVSAHPALHEAIPFPRAEVAVKRWWKAAARRRLRQLLATLRDGHYDLVVDCQGLGRSGYFTRATRASVRVGYASAGELGWLGYNRRVEVPREMHTVDRMLALVEAIGVRPVRDMRLYTPAEGGGGASPDPRLIRGRYAVIAPTSRWEGKRWPADRFAQVAHALLQDGRAEALAIVGGANERDQCGPVLELCESDPRVVDLVGKTSVAGLMGVIERSALVIANDSAALHMAVGFDRPIVALFGPTRTALVGPYGRAGDVIQPGEPPPGVSHKDADAGRTAMAQIPADLVIDAALRRLALTGSDTADPTYPPRPPQHA